MPQVAINQARVSLMDRSYDDVLCEWSEYIPRNFAPVVSPLAEAMHALFFGTSPDRWYLNHAASCYLTLAGASSLRDLLPAGPLSYPLPVKAIDSVSRLPLTRVETTLGPAGQVEIVGDLAFDAYRGRMETTYDIWTREGGVYITSFGRPDISDASPPIDQAVQLWDTGQSVKIVQQPSDTHTSVQSVARPGWSLPFALQRAREIAPSTREDLFAAIPSAIRDRLRETYRDTGSELEGVDRVSALVIGFIHYVISERG
jgi:hypothetical protein